MALDRVGGDVSDGSIRNDGSFDDGDDVSDGDDGNSVIRCDDVMVMAMDAVVMIR